jgi:hypothetical protein
MRIVDAKARKMRVLTWTRIPNQTQTKSIDPQQIYSVAAEIVKRHVSLPATDTGN